MTAQDFGSESLSSTAFVIITVLDQNDNPPRFVPDSGTIELEEDTPTGAVLYTARATDGDSTAQLVYSISTNETKLFSIDATSGNLLLDQSLDFEQATVHFVVIEASDGISTATFDLTISVLDVNDNPPVFVQSTYNVSIPENTTIGENVLLGLQPLQVVDADQDSNTAVQFSIESGGSQNQFAVNLISSDTAELIVTGGLDREVEDEYNLVVVAQDPTNPDFNSTATVTIHILDVNDNAPQFDVNLYNFSVKENSNTGTTVGVVMATDSDVGENGHVTYTIASGDPGSHFVVSSEGEIQTSSQTIDRETISLFTLTVMAEDGGTPPQTSLTTVLVAVLDVNDNPPVFAQSSYRTSLFENSPPGTTLSSITVLAEDNEDIGINAEVIYRVHTNNATMFSIDPVTGILTSLIPFDYETEPTDLQIVVVASDVSEAPLSAQALVTVALLDVNEFAPQFAVEEYSVQIAEDINVLSPVLTISADDLDGDTGAFVEYSLFDPDDSLPFTVDNETGVVYTTEALDREAVDSYQLLAIASNPLGMPVLSSSVAVTVTVLDVNDNAPIFMQEDYFAAITTGFEVGNQILTISANDIDLGLNGTVQYSLAESNTRFSLTASTGVISSTQPFESTGTFTLTVVAADLGTPSLSGNATVTINIVQPVDIQFSQDGAGFLLQQGTSSTLQQQFGFFVNSPPGNSGRITASLGEVTAEAVYSTDLPQAVSLRGVVLNDEAWHDQPEVKVFVQVMDGLGDVHCSPVQVVIRVLPDSTLQNLANLTPQVGHEIFMTVIIHT